MTSPAITLPTVADARLPVAYEQAKQALAEAYRLDECKAWSDRAAALASYARQAQDDSLLKHAQRIQGRAVQRAGELLKDVDARGQKKPWDDNTVKSGGAPTSSQRETAEAAGMSKDQQVQAVRIASIPKDEFEQLIESDAPPTVTALAEMGKKPRPTKVIDHTNGADPKDFAAATQALAALRRLHQEVVRDIKPATVVRGSSADEQHEASIHARAIAAWLEELKNELESTDGV